MPKKSEDIISFEELEKAASEISPAFSQKNKESDKSDQKNFKELKEVEKKLIGEGKYLDDKAASKGESATTLNDNSGISLASTEQTELEDFHKLDLAQRPEFHSGIDAFKDYLQSALEYPEPAKSNKVEGIVTVQFVIDENDNITKVKVLEFVSPALDEEAKSVIKSMPS